LIKTDKKIVVESIKTFLQCQRKLEHTFSQTDISAQTGITQSQLSNYESGKMLPSLSAIIALADMFDVSVDYLVGRCENKNSHKTRKEVVKYRKS